nr:DNA polymerase III subunit delta [Lolliginicoccus suaedae]
MWECLSVPLHLLLGDEEYLVERSLRRLIEAARAASDDAAGMQLTRMRAGDASISILAEMLSPSLFGEDRIVALDDAHEAGKDAVEVITSTARDMPDGVTLIVHHTGGGRAKALAGTLQKLGAETHRCAKLNASERVEFVRTELRDHGVRASPDVITTILDAVGSNLRELASACSQLAADTGGAVTAEAVQRYYSGRAEVTGFDVADKAVAGNRAAALASVRWALHTGTPHVLLADALGEAIRSIARVAAAGRGDPGRLAGQLGMPPWKVRKTQQQARAWRPDTLAVALRVVTRLNGDVKGGAADADYALERAIMQISSLAD